MSNIENSFLKHPSEEIFDKYLREISELPLLSPEEEIELARKIKEGDHDALERLTRCNLRFVVSVARQYQNQGLSLGDVVNAGNLGLIKAATRFDETRGFKFISYAVWWIRQSILQTLAEQSRIVRIPLNRIGAIKKIERILTSLEQEYEREPSAAEIASALHMNQSEVDEVLRTTDDPISLDAPFSNGDENRLIDLLEDHELPPPDRELLDESLKIEIEASLASLDERDAQIIRLYYGIGLDHPVTLEEIGEKLQLTRERVRQIKEKALRRLRHSSRSNKLKKYLG